MRQIVEPKNKEQKIHERIFADKPLYFDV